MQQRIKKNNLWVFAAPLCPPTCCHTAYCCCGACLLLLWGIAIERLKIEDCIIPPRSGVPRDISQPRALRQYCCSPRRSCPGASQPRSRCSIPSRFSQKPSSTASHAPTAPAKQCSSRAFAAGVLARARFRLGWSVSGRRHKSGQGTTERGRSHQGWSVATLSNFGALAEQHRPDFTPKICFAKSASA